MNEKFDAIRKKVEERADSNKDIPETGDSVSKEMMQEYKTAIEELRVADEELRSQNEQLMIGHLAIEQERERYRELFEFTPDAYLVTDEMGVVQEANQAALLLLNIDYPFLIGKPLITFVSQTERRQFRSLIGRIDQVTDVEMCFKQRKGPNFEAAVRIAEIKGPGSDIVGFRWIIRDITEQKRLVQELLESQERFQKIFINASPGIALLKKNGQIIDSNPAFQSMMQFTAEQMQNVELTRFVRGEDRPIFKARLHHLLVGSVENTTAEIRFLRKDKRVFWGLVSFSTIPHHKNNELHVILFIDDITAQKQLSAERLEMQHRVIDSIEAERAHLARELHDNPLQTLNGALFMLADVSSEGLDEENRQKFDQVRGVLRDVANSIRLTCGELRSPSLNTFGLKKGIVAYFDRFKEINPDMQIHLIFEGEDLPLPERLALALYRILQESMANVMRHAQATQVDITLKLFEDLISLRIADNGKGFKPPDNLVDLMRVGHYGLSGIAERVEMIDGNLKIESAPGTGTVIEVTVSPWPG